MHGGPAGHKCVVDTACAELVRDAYRCGSAYAAGDHKRKLAQRIGDLVRRQLHLAYPADHNDCETEGRRFQHARKGYGQRKAGYCCNGLTVNSFRQCFTGILRESPGFEEHRHEDAGTEEPGNESRDGSACNPEGREPEMAENEQPVEEYVQDIGCDRNPHRVPGVSESVGEEAGAEEYGRRNQRNQHYEVIGLREGHHLRILSHPRHEEADAC